MSPQQIITEYYGRISFVATSATSFVLADRLIARSVIVFLSCPSPLLTGVWQIGP